MFPRRSDDPEENEWDEGQLDPSPLPEETLMAMEEQQAITNAFQLLPGRCKRLLWYLFYDKSGLSNTEIGIRLGIPEGSIGPSRARCLDKLRTLLEEADRA